MFFLKVSPDKEENNLFGGPFDNVAGYEAPVQAFCCEFSELIKYSFSPEHYQATAPILRVA